jgi:hypothetical protein
MAGTDAGQQTSKSAIWSISADPNPNTALAGHDTAQLEVLNTILDVYGSDAVEFVPLSNPPLDSLQQDLIRLGIVQDLVTSAIDILGASVLSKYNTKITLESNGQDISREAQEEQQAQGSEKSSIAGAILQRLISDPPASLSSNRNVQQIFFTIFERLMETLQGGSASKRALGNLTNALTSFRETHVSLRRRLWVVLGKSRDAQNLPELSSMSDNHEHSWAMDWSDENAQGKLICIEQHLSNACRASR